ncbi:MAG: phosphonate ABC transporter, permease protein PhnE, partial [Vagococcus sp.]
MNQKIEATLNQEPSKKVQYLMLTTIIVGAFVWSLSAIQFNAVDDGGWKIATSIIQGILTPDMELLWN